MTQDEINQQLIAEVKRLNDELNKMRDVYYRTHFIDKDIFQNPVYFNGLVYFKKAVSFAIITFLKNVSIETGSSTGLKLGATGDKLGFLGKTPVVQQSAITAPSTPSAGYVQAEAQSTVDKINEIRAVLTAFGLTA